MSVLGYRVVKRNRAELAEAAIANTLAEPAATATATATAEPAVIPSAAEAASAEPAAVAASGSSAAATSASAAEPAAGAAEPAASAAAAPSPPADTEIRKITVKSKPPKVRFFHFGKQVGVTPFVLEFKPGERHAYEAALPGYGTRRVVIDGSKSQILVGLTPEKR